MTRDVERAPAKINVCLFLGPTRPSDRRHELVSIMQGVTLFDELVLEAAPGGHDEVVCAGVVGPNLALDAVTAFRARTGWDGPPVRVSITKRIPVAAGMAGGSADAAATLRLVARASGIGDATLLREVARGLGADVPAQITPGRVLATGAGEEVDPLTPVGPRGVLVLPGEAPLSTPDVFREADRLGLGVGAAALGARLAEVRGAGHELPEALVVNDLQAAALSLQPSIAAALADARDVGARVAMVSGSGPTVLGLFDAPEEAERAAAALSGRRTALAAAYLAAAGW